MKKALSALVAGVFIMAASCHQMQWPPVTIAQRPLFTQFTPPPVYRTWWQQMEDCTGRHGDFDLVTFWVVEAREGFLNEEDPDDSLLGVYDGTHRKIYVTQPGMFSRLLVSHEMIHALGQLGHPDSVFKVACGLPG